MKRSLTLLMLAVNLLAAAGGMAGSAVTGAEVITVYPAREIVTLDPVNPHATAIAVKGTKILAAGSVASIADTFPRQKLEVDDRFADKVLVPGLINQHEHPFLAALALATNVISIEDWVLPNKRFPRASDPAEYRQRLKQAIDAFADEQPVFYSWGYHQLWHGALDRSDLDELNYSLPIVIWHRSAHEFILNTPALAYFGITQVSLKKLTTSEQTQVDWQKGRFWEQGAVAVIPAIMRDMAQPEKYMKGLKLVRDYWHAAGSTWVVEPGGLGDKGIQSMQNEVFAPVGNPFHMDYIANGALPARSGKDTDLVDEVEKQAGWAAGMSRFLPGQVKLFADGAIFSQLMKMQDGYTDGHHGEWMMDPDLFADVFRTYWDEGYQIHVHQNGDEGLEMVLDVLEENLARHPRKDHRTVIVHFGFSTREQVARIAALGAIVSANPYYPIALADKYSEVGIGAARAHEMVRLNDLVREGVSFSLHSDMPMAPGRPLYLMWCAVNRVTLAGNLVGPEQRISPEQALRAVTIDAAYSLRMEEQVGSIEPGKLANITVLAENPLTVDPGRIKDIEVWGTIHEGRVLPVTP